MTDRDNRTSTDRTPLTLTTRLLGVFRSPAGIFRQLGGRPPWLDVVAVLMVASAVTTGAFLATRVGRQALLDRVERSVEAFGVPMTDELYDRIARQTAASSTVVIGPVVAAAAAPLAILAVAGLAFAFLGGRRQVTFRETVSVVAHAWVIPVGVWVALSPFNYAWETLGGATNLAAWLPMLDDSGFLARVLGSIDLVLIWWLIVLSLGLSALYRRRMGSLAAGLLAVYLVLALAAAAFRTAVSGA